MLPWFVSLSYPDHHHYDHHDIDDDGDDDDDGEQVRQERESKELLAGVLATQPQVGCPVIIRGCFKNAGKVQGLPRVRGEGEGGSRNDQHSDILPTSQQNKIISKIIMEKNHNWHFYQPCDHQSSS